MHTTARRYPSCAVRYAVTAVSALGLLALAPPAATEPGTSLRSAGFVGVNKAAADLVFGAEHTSPPYVFIDDRGRPQGYALEILRQAATARSLRIDIVAGEWTDVLAGVDAGLIDLTAMTQSAERLERYTWIAKLATFRTVVLFPTGRPKYPGSIADLDDEIISVMDQSVLHDLLSSLPGAPRLLPVADSTEAVRAVADGRATGAAANAITGRQRAMELGLADPVELPIKLYAYGFAMRRGTEDKARPLTEALTAMAERGDLQRYAEAFLAPPPPPIDWRRIAPWAIGVLGVLAAVIAGISIWNEALRRRVRVRTQDLQTALDDVRASRAQVEAQARQLAAQASDLEHSRDEALEAARTKSVFLASMSHELRTPLHGILGMTSLLCETPLTSDQSELAHTARRSAESLLAVVNDILDFSRIESGKLKVEAIRFDLGELAEDVVQSMAQPAHGKGLDLSCTVDAAMPAEVWGDPTRVRQVLMNLVGNAVKFTARGGVAVAVTLQPTDLGHEAVVAVTDTGVGISDDSRARLFKPFSQADASTTRRFGGTGLGLAICHHLMKLMGGRIGFESTVGEGTRFWFTLPVAAAVAPEAAPAWDVEVQYVGAGQTRDSVRATLGARAVRLREHETLEAAFAAARGAATPVVLADSRLWTARDWQFLDESLLSEGGVRWIVLVPFGKGGPPAAARAGSAIRVVSPVRRRHLYDALAIARGETPASRAAEAGAEDAPLNARVLLAEDNPVNKAVALRMLERLGLEVDVVENGVLAVEAASRETYDLIFMDCEMPELDGLAACRQIRKREADGPRTPIVAMTAHAMSEHRARGLAAGMDDYLTKPFTPEALRDVLVRWLDPKRRAA